VFRDAMVLVTSGLGYSLKYRHNKATEKHIIFTFLLLSLFLTIISSLRHKILD